MEIKLCSAHVYNGLSFRPSKCSKSGRYEEDGKFYCAVHRPSKVEERHQKSRAKWDLKVEISRLKSAINLARISVVIESVRLYRSTNKSTHLLEGAVAHMLECEQNLENAQKEIECV